MTKNPKTVSKGGAIAVLFGVLVTGVAVLYLFVF